MYCGVQILYRKLSKLVAGARQILVVLAQVPQLPDDPVVCNASMAELLEQYSLYINFGLAGLDGNVVCRGLPLNDPVNITGRPCFQNVLKTHDFALSEGQTGRCLPICKRLIERQDGWTWVESQPGQGTTFYFTSGGG